MPEKTLRESITAAWPQAHAKAVEALAGVGANEPIAKRHAHRVHVGEVAMQAFRDENVPVKLVRASITWGQEKPQVSLEVITMAGERFEGGSVIDQRASVDEVGTVVRATTDLEAEPGGDTAEVERGVAGEATTGAPTAESVEPGKVKKFWQSVVASDPAKPTK